MIRKQNVRKAFPVEVMKIKALKILGTKLKEKMFAIYADEDVSKTNHFGLDYVGCVEDVCRQDFKKINISKKSYVLLTVWFVFCLACCLLKI